jgi:NADP-dependent 3-hydroxy acid dehydrogenase YdfG
MNDDAANSTAVNGDAANGRGVAVVTGASSGIGAACTRRLAGAGFHVVAVARRADRLEALAAELGETVTPVACDVTSDAEVARMVEAVRTIGGPTTLLVNNAGGARGLDPIGEAKVDDWQWMYDVNVLGTLRVTQALLPDLEASGAGSVIVMSSTAGLIVYEGGAGYAAAKHAQTALAETLRLELSGRPIRVIEIDPGMVRTDEFGLVRFGGDRDKAFAAYAGVAEPLLAEDIAECVTWSATLAHHINIDRMVVRPLAQAAQHKVHRVLP